MMVVLHLVDNWNLKAMEEVDLVKVRFGQYGESFYWKWSLDILKQGSPRLASLQKLIVFSLFN